MVSTYSEYLEPSRECRRPGNLCVSRRFSSAAPICWTNTESRREFQVRQGPAVDFFGRSGCRDPQQQALLKIELDQGRGAALICLERTLIETGRSCSR